MKFGDFLKGQDPLTGKEMSILDLNGWISKILGVVMLFIVFAAGQNLAGKVGSKLPVDTKIDPIISQPTISNSRRVY
jgi:hypothetical protein